MEVVYSYSKIQLDQAVIFISKHNSHFLGQDEYIRQSMLDMMEELAHKFPNCGNMGTMGFHISTEYLYKESMEEDENHVNFSISIDPGLAGDDNERYMDEDIQENIINVARSKRKSVSR